MTTRAEWACRALSSSVTTGCRRLRWRRASGASARSPITTPIAELDCNPVVVAPTSAAIVNMQVRLQPVPPLAPIGSPQGL
jgi:hypothetical protein